jgi:hypothetical protein
LVTAKTPLRVTGRLVGGVDQMRRQQHLLATRSYIVRKLTWAIDVWAEGVASTKEDDMQFVAIVLVRGGKVN